jgi:hypothetical protein
VCDGDAQLREGGCGGDAQVVEVVEVEVEVAPRGRKVSTLAYGGARMSPSPDTKAYVERYIPTYSKMGKAPSLRCVCVSRRRCVGVGAGCGRWGELADCAWRCEQLQRQRQPQRQGRPQPAQAARAQAEPPLARPTARVHAGEVLPRDPIEFKRDPIEPTRSLRSLDPPPGFTQVRFRRDRVSPTGD